MPPSRPDPDPAGPARTVVPVVAAGGVIGALARHGVDVAWPAEPGAFPWGTFGVNVLGCVLIGVLMAVVVDAGRGHPLLRPFLGVGVLGGFTTFSAYATQTVTLADRGAPLTSALYVGGTLVAALAGVVLGLVVGRAACGVRA